MALGEMCSKISLNAKGIQQAPQHNCRFVRMTPTDSLPPWDGSPKGLQQWNLYDVDPTCACRMPRCLFLFTEYVIHSLRLDVDSIKNVFMIAPVKSPFCPLYGVGVKLDACCVLFRATHWCEQQARLLWGSNICIKYVWHFGTVTQVRRRFES